MIKKFISFITTILMFYALVCSVLMILQIVLDVTGRYIWVPLPGTVIIVSFWYMPAFIFLTIAYAERERAHIEVTLFTDHLPQFWIKMFTVLGSIVMFIIFFILGWFGLDFAIDSYQVREFKEDIVNILVWPATFYIPIGCWVLCAQLGLHIFEDLKTMKELRIHD